MTLFSPQEVSREYSARKAGDLLVRELSDKNLSDALTVIDACFPSLDDRLAARETYERYLSGKREYLSEYSAGPIELLRYEVHYYREQPVAVSGLYRHEGEENVVWMGFFGVLSDYRRSVGNYENSTGLSVSEQILEWLKIDAAQNFDAQTLKVFASLDEAGLPARRFYERHGFCKEREFVRFGEADVEYALELGVRPELSSVSLRALLNEHPEEFERLFSECFAGYVAAFPDENEREDAETLRRYLSDSGSNWDILAVFEKDQLIGARHYAVLDTGHEEIGKVAVGEHLWVVPTERRKGRGTLIVQESEKALQAHGARFAISEQNDPWLMTEHEIAKDKLSGIDPHSRLKFWQRQRYAAIDAPYIQPSLEEAQNSVRYLRLALRALDNALPESLSSGAYLAILRAYLGTWTEDIEKNPDYLEIKAAVERVSELPLIPLTSKRSFLQARK